MIDEKKLIEELKKRVRTKRSKMEILRDIIPLINGQPKVGEWIPCSDQMPNCCGYPVLLTVENIFGQRDVCKAFTNYMKEGKLLFYTNEKEYCSELTSSKLSNAWKPIAWMPLPEPYRMGEEL